MPRAARRPRATSPAARSACSTRPWTTSSARSAAPRSACRSPRWCPALQQGVVDCAVTGTLSGNTAGWPEVSTHLYPMYLGWSINYQGVNLDSWNNFPPEVQAFFERAVRRLRGSDVGHRGQGGGRCGELQLRQGAVRARQDGVDDAGADQRCGQGEARADDAGHRAGRVGQALRQGLRGEWNGTVGAVVGLEIPLDQL